MNFARYIKPKKMKRIIQIMLVGLVFIASWRGFCLANNCFPNNWNVKNDTVISINSLAANDSLLFASINKSGIYKSNDYGNNWELINIFKNIKLNASLLYVKDSIVIVYDIYGLCFISLDFGEHWVIDFYFVNNIQSLCFLKLNNLIIAGTNHGLFEIDFVNSDGKWNEVYYFKDIDCSLLEYYENTLYIASDKGIIYGDYVKKEWNNIKSIDNNKYIYSLIPLNSFVYATVDSGVFCYNKSNKVWQNITYNVEKADGGYDGVLRLFATKGKIYVYSANNGLMYLDKFNSKWIKCNIYNLSDNKSRSNWSIVEINNYIYIGSQSIGIYKSYDGDLFFPFNGNIPKVIY